MNVKSPIYHLAGFVNSLCVIPSFIYPVFTDGNYYYFEDGKSDNIKSFQMIDIEKCDIIPWEVDEIYTINSKTLYAFMLSDSEIVHGDSSKITNFLNGYYKNIDDEVLIKEINVFFYNLELMIQFPDVDDIFGVKVAREKMRANNKTGLLNLVRPEGEGKAA